MMSMPSATISEIVPVPKDSATSRSTVQTDRKRQADEEGDTAFAKQQPGSAPALSLLVREIIVDRLFEIARIGRGAAALR